MSSDYVNSLDSLALMSAAMACAADKGEDFIRVKDIRDVVEAVFPDETVLETFESMDLWSLDRVRVVFWEIAQTFHPSRTLARH